MTEADTRAEKLALLWKKLHDEAVANEQEFYVDPQSGLMVGTELRLKRRGYCCQSGCRHCPYGFIKPS